MEYFKFLNIVILVLNNVASVSAIVYLIRVDFLGDPNDKRLRKVEKDVLIPQKMRDKAREEKCVKEVQGDSNF